MYVTSTGTAIAPVREFYDDYYLDHPPFSPDDDYRAVTLKARTLFGGERASVGTKAFQTVIEESERRIAQALSSVKTAVSTLSPKKDNPYSLFPIISIADQIKVAEIVHLHDLAMTRAVARDGHSKTSEGHLSLSFGNYWNRIGEDADAPPVGVSLYAYVVGDGRSHHFGTIDRALETVRYWYARELSLPPQFGDECCDQPDDGDDSGFSL